MIKRLKGKLYNMLDGKESYGDYVLGKGDVGGSCNFKQDVQGQFQ